MPKVNLTLEPVSDTGSISKTPNALKSSTMMYMATSVSSQWWRLKRFVS